MSPAACHARLAPGGNVWGEREVRRRAEDQPPLPTKAQLVLRQLVAERGGDRDRPSPSSGLRLDPSVLAVPPVLERRGLVESRRYYYADATVWSITAAGLREGGLRLQVPKIDTRSYEHDLAGGWLCIEYEFGVFGVIIPLPKFGGS